MALTALLASLLPHGYPAEAPECSAYFVRGLGPGMRVAEVRKKMGAKEASVQSVPGPFGLATEAVYVGAGILASVRYDRDIYQTPNAKAVLVRVCGAVNEAVPITSPRSLRQAFGEPAQGAENLDTDLRSGSAVWSNDACEVDVTAFREEAEWWEPLKSRLCVQVESHRYADTAAPRRGTGANPSSGTAVKPVPVPPPEAPGASASPPQAGESAPKEPRDSSAGPSAAPSEPVAASGGSKGATPDLPPSPDGSPLAEPRDVDAVRIPEACAPPRFPELARRWKKGARVHIQAVVRSDGSMGSIKVLECTQPGLGFEQSAIDAVRQWKYQPALKDGKPVESVVEFWIGFTD